MLDLYNISVSESEPTEPVTLDEAKAWAVVDHDDHDDLLTDMITGAREDIEQELNVKLVTSDIVAYLNTTKSERISVFPWALNLANVDTDNLTVHSLEDGEPDEALTIDEDYYLNGALKIGEGSFKVSYPIVPIVPTAIKEAIKMLVAYRYNNRGEQDKQQGMPEDIERKISKYRQIWL